jgi:hypothetical protein
MGASINVDRAHYTYHLGHYLAWGVWRSGRPPVLRDRLLRRRRIRSGDCHPFDPHFAWQDLRERPASLRYGLSRLPYFIDTCQEVTRAYDAQRTPDFLGFNAQDEPQYRGRLDASGVTPIPTAGRDLFEAMKQVAEIGHGPQEQFHPWAVRSSGSTDR